MSAVATQEVPELRLTGEAPPSPAGPLAAPEPLALPPARQLPRLLQTLRFGMRPMSFNLSARRELGDVWQVQLMSRAGQFVVTSHSFGAQVAMLSATFLLLAVMVDCGWAVAAGRARGLLAVHGRLRNRISGGLLVGAGIGLAFARKS